LATPDLDLIVAFRRVLDEVMAASNRSQQPFVYGSLGGDIVAIASTGERAEDEAAPLDQEGAGSVCST
jgi:hypothetical protein